MLELYYYNIVAAVLEVILRSSKKFTAFRVLKVTNHSSNQHVKKCPCHLGDESLEMLLIFAAVTDLISWWKLAICSCRYMQLFILQRPCSSYVMFRPIWLKAFSRGFPAFIASLIKKGASI